MLSTNNLPTKQAVIYLVDHDENTLASLTSLLAPLNATIKCFTSAESFLEHNISKNAACLVLEAHLQEVHASGIELLEYLVRQGYRIPTIVMTRMSDIPTAVRAMQASAVDFIEKPYVEHVVVKQVEAILRQY